MISGERVPADVQELAADLGHDYNDAETAEAVTAAGRKGFTVGLPPNLEQLDAAVLALYGGKPARPVRKYARAEVFAVLTGGPR